MSNHIAIIGGGPAGCVAASHAAAEGANVILIDPHPLGAAPACIAAAFPPRPWWRSANLLEKMRRAETYGLRLNGSIEADWQAMRAKARQVVGLLNRGIDGLIVDRNVTHIQGRGCIVDVSGLGRQAVHNPMKRERPRHASTLP